MSSLLPNYPSLIILSEVDFHKEGFCLAVRTLADFYRFGDEIIDLMMKTQFFEMCLYMEPGIGGNLISVWSFERKCSAV